MDRGNLRLVVSTLAARQLKCELVSVQSGLFKNLRPDKNRRMILENIRSLTLDILGRPSAVISFSG
jgi:hypothetical protein